MGIPDDETLTAVIAFGKSMGHETFTKQHENATGFGAALSKAKTVMRGPFLIPHPTFVSLCAAKT